MEVVREEKKVKMSLYSDIRAKSENPHFGLLCGEGPKFARSCAGMGIQSRFNEAEKVTLIL
jgi:hypothetical protein